MPQNRRREYRGAHLLISNLHKKQRKCRMIFVVNLAILVRLMTSGNSVDIKAMIEIDNSYENYAVNGKRSPDQDGFPLGFALLTVLGLSLFGWMVVLAPLALILHK